MVALFTVALTLLEHSRSCFELYSVCEKMKAQPKIDMKQGEQSLFLPIILPTRKMGEVIPSFRLSDCLNVKQTASREMEY